MTSRQIRATNTRNDYNTDNDFYATDPIAIDKLFTYEDFNTRIWEPAAGAGHLSERMKAYDKEVYSTDLINRNYGRGGGGRFSTMH